MAGLVKFNSYDYICENLWVGILTNRFEFDIDGWPMKYLGLALGKIQESIFWDTCAKSGEEIRWRKRAFFAKRMEAYISTIKEGKKRH